MLRKKCLVALSSLLLSGAACADIVLFKFSGTVTYGGTLAATGVPVSGVFAYDTATAPSASSAGYADYAISAPFSIYASVAGHSLSANNLHVTISDNAGGNVEDSISVFGGPVVLDNSSFYPEGSFGFTLASGPGSTRALTSTALPSSLKVRSFDAGPSLNYGWVQKDGAEGGQLLQFSIDSIVSIGNGKSGRHPSE